MDSQHPLPYSFNEVYLEELRYVRPEAFASVATAVSAVPLEVGGQNDDTGSTAARQERAANLRDIYKNVHEQLHVKGGIAAAPLSALCLSGGGIRSATFNLGVLQRLASLRLLDRFDYLSSVSGGGYISAWLQGWMHRAGVAVALGQLAVPAPSLSPTRDPLAPEPKPVDHLREYSNYLTPKVSLFAPDSWAAGALILRNLVLNWLVLVPVLAAFVAVPQLSLLLMKTVPSPATQSGVVGGAILLALLASFFVHLLRHPNQSRGRAGQRTIVMLAVLPLYAAAALLSLSAAWAPWAWWGAGDSRGRFLTGPLAHAAWRSDAALFISIWTIIIPVIGWLAAELWRRLKRERSTPASLARAAWWEFLALLVSGITSGLLLWWVIDSVACGPECVNRFDPFERSSVMTVLALPALLANYLLARAVYVAVASVGERTLLKYGGGDSAWNDHDREWWGRLSGWLLALALGWLGLSLMSLFGSYALEKSGAYVKAAIAAAGGITAVLTALLAKSGATSAGRGTNTASKSVVADIALKFTAPVFVMVLLIFLAIGNEMLATTIIGDATLFKVKRDTIALAATSLAPLPVTANAVGKFLILPVAFVLGAFLLSLCVDVNRFSLHGFYRNRLIRAFLGASNAGRQTDPFTGFALSDNLHLSKLAPEKPGARRVCLFPVYNTTLNLVTGTQRLAWQLRKAESFSMSPLFCGNFHEGYRRSTEYGGRNGLTLGTAITVSGAAANPNMGYNSSPSITFLMTLFNARLGAWLGNTNENGRDTFDKSGPRVALWPLVAELLGHTDSNHAHINLSDGGHFDNLGLYEMVLRRCHYVLVCDAGRDPSAGFEDLGNVIRKIRIDFGIPIEFRERIRIVPRGGKEEENLFCATADIVYSAADGSGAWDGRLVYIKPALSGRGKSQVPYDVLAYANTSPDFPHESTTDQWFDEAQFESYRALGLHTIQQITLDQSPVTDLAAFFNAVDDYLAATASRAASVAPTSAAVDACIPSPE